MPECGSTFQRTSPAPFTVWLLGLWIPAVSEQELKGQPHHGGSALEAVTTSPMDATIFQEHQGREPTTAQWPRTVTLGLKEPTDVVFLVTFYMQLQISNSFGEAGNLATVVLDSQKAIKNSCHLPRGMQVNELPARRRKGQITRWCPCLQISRSSGWQVPLEDCRQTLLWKFKGA
ncbi:uncharacterized protein LOC134807896 isoform X3 [Pan troglodytes]|uniref:uncharacterized protein LOC134807896 isoform X3 n=1 Tax=Pan troglodytes TaxID=9598 RepID=UPI00301404FC